MLLTWLRCCRRGEAQEEYVAMAVDDDDAETRMMGHFAEQSPFWLPKPSSADSGCYDMLV